MNPIDTNNNSSIRSPRSDAEQVSRRGKDVDTAATRGPAPADGASAGESVSFTDTAAELLALESQLRELPGIDQERVESIRQSIANGSYEIDASRIVDSLLQSERELV